MILIQKPRDVIGGLVVIAIGAGFFLSGQELEMGTSFRMGNCSTHPHDRKHLIQNSFPKRHAAVQRQYLDRGSSWHKY